MSVAKSGNDSVKLNNRIFADFVDGDAFTLTFPNDSASVKTGKNGNAIYGQNASGKQADAQMRLVRGSDDDKFMNSVFAQQESDFAAFPLIFGEFTKLVGDATGKVLQDNYILSGGVISKAVEGKSNAEGDTEQSTTVWHMKFSKAVRVIA